MPDLSPLLLPGLLLAAASVVAGLLAGLLGVGGGIVIVPMLFWLLTSLDLPPDLVMHIAVATSLVTIIPTSLSSSASHRRRGNVDSALLGLWGPGVLVGAALGGFSAKIIDGVVLSGIFGVIALLISLNMVTSRSIRVADTPPASALVNRFIAAVVGFFSALMGIGGGTLSVPILTAYGFPILKAVGTASAFGLLIAVPAVAGFIWAGWGIADLPFGSLGYVNLPAALLISPITVVMAPIGARIASSINQRALRLCFAVFLAITAVRMLMQIIG
ncbi:sulfite exporter TauE/SafE family protein [uncultured Devosia sp.]|uniref:sulfite exporter TauE/SafE family protein n=1 Tax=uncultured Devosia sp. TaxID=211434 RepID=UPI0035CAEBFE